MGLIQIAKDKLESYGVEPQHLTKTLIYYQGISFGIYFASCSLCYRYKPLQTIKNSPYFRAQIQKIEAYPLVKKTELKIQQSTLVKRFSETSGTKPRLVARSMVEGLIFSKLLSPITTPTEIYLAYKLVKFTSEKKEN